MKPLIIGSPVIVSAVTEMRYDNDNRVATRRSCQPFEAKITGLANRQEGRYRRGSEGTPWWGMDFEEASLSVSKVQRLWLVRVGMMNKEMTIADDDLEPLDRAVDLPLRRIGVPMFLEQA